MTDAEDRGREERVIFALDIGTRSVTGVVGEIENGMLRVLGVETQEHAERAVVAAGQMLSAALGYQG